MMVMCLLASIGLVVVVTFLVRAMWKMMLTKYRKSRVCSLQQLGIDVLYQAPNRGKLHSDPSCESLRHLEENGEIKLEWCDHCRRKIEKRIWDIKED